MNNSDSTLFAIVVPCFNEAKRIDANVFKSFLSKRTDIFVLFVNDGSTDNTEECLKKIVAMTTNGHHISLAKNVGKAEAIRQGFNWIMKHKVNYQYLAFWDADLALPLDEAVFLYNLIKEEKKDAVFCCRFRRLGSSITRSIWRHLSSRFFATLVSVLTNLPVYDSQCGGKVFSRKSATIAFRQEFISKWLFDVEILFRLKKATLTNLYEHPVRSCENHGNSRIKIFDYIVAPIILIFIFLNYQFNLGYEKKVECFE